MPQPKLERIFSVQETAVWLVFCSTKCSDQELLVNAHELGRKSF
uniref:Pco093185f n=1 Tax=Arundo donax TaxID=35708 RepID=A0A0A9EXS3_ARUDO